MLQLAIKYVINILVNAHLVLLDIHYQWIDI